MRDTTKQLFFNNYKDDEDYYMASTEEVAMFNSLSKREKEALSLYYWGLSYEKIAEEMVLTPGAVSTYMSRAYKKLGLFELDQKERLRKLLEIYSPLFDADIDELEEEPEEILEAEIEELEEHPEEVLEAEIEELEDHPEDVSDAQTNALMVTEDSIEFPSPEEEEILIADQKALIVLHQKQQNDEPQKSKKEKPKRRGCRVFIRRLFTLLVVILLALGGIGWYLWENDDLDSLPFDVNEIIAIPQTLVAEYFGSSQTSELLAQKPTNRPTSTFPPVPTNKPATRPTNTSKPLPSNTSRPLPTNTPRPSSTNTPKPLVTGPIYEFTDWHKEDDLWIRLYKYEVRSGNIYFQIEMWNKSNQTIYFSWSPEQNIVLKDNLGNIYTVDDFSVHYKPDEETLDAQERMDLDVDPTNYTVGFDADYIFDAGVTDIYLTVEYISRIDKATWHIEIGK